MRNLTLSSWCTLYYLFLLDSSFEYIFSKYSEGTFSKTYFTRNAVFMQQQEIALKGGKIKVMTIHNSNCCDITTFLVNTSLNYFFNSCGKVISFIIWRYFHQFCDCGSCIHTWIAHTPAIKYYSYQKQITFSITKYIGISTYSRCILLYSWTQCNKASPWHT